MNGNYRLLFQKAWYLCNADSVYINWDGDIEQIAAQIPVKYWEQAKSLTLIEAYQVYAKEEDW